MAANVMFKRGLQNQVPLTAATDGVFYLTTDTHRLYVGQGANAVLLNQTVQFVDTVSKLTEISSAWKTDVEKAAHLQDLYYVLPHGGGDNSHNGNILAVWVKDSSNQYAWVQINPDHNTHVTRMTQNVTSITNGANLNTRIDTNDADLTLSGLFAVVGSNKTVKVEAAADGKGIVITGDTYTMSRGEVGEIKLTSALGQAGSSVKVVAGSNVTVTNGTGANEIQVAAKDTKTTTVGVGLDATGKLTVQVTDSEGTTKAGSTNLTLNYGANGQASVPVGGKLDVYTIGEVDEKLKKLDGMTYVGTISASSDSTGTYKMGADFVPYNGATKLPAHNGDMFLVVGAKDVEYATGKFAKNGDLLIATGAEDAATGNLTSVVWSYVPSGDDNTLDTTYVFTANAAGNMLTIQSKSSLDGDTKNVGQIKLEAGTAVKITSTANGGNLTSTIAHADVAHTENATSPNLDDATTFEAVSGITVNEQGHVTNIDKATYKLPTYKQANPNVTATLTGGVTSEVTIKEGLQKGSSNPVYNAGFKLKSDTLSMTATGGNVTVELQWGTF